MGVGSEVYSAVRKGRKGIGIELKDSYYRQAIANLGSITDSPSNVPSHAAPTIDQTESPSTQMGLL